VSAFGCGFVDGLLTGYASRLMAKTEQGLLESRSQSVSQSALNLLSDYARLCSVSATNLLA